MKVEPQLPSSATIVWNMCIVQRDRIILGDAPAWFERILAGRVARIFAAVGAVILMASAVKLPLIASGGVTTLEDIRRLAKLGLAGCIIGRALYEGKLDLSEAIKEGVHSP